jgi:nitrate reductase molybdenum cofactor assembly chaperone
MTAAERFDALAALLAYPGREYFTSVRKCQELLADDPGSLALVGPMSMEALQELFIQTFDLSPVCTLELGWHLYGENYERGAFLVRMREQLRECGLLESDELPDHLTHVLAVLGRMQPEAACGFASRFVLPAMAKMLEGLKDKQNPFENVMKAIWRNVHALCPEIALTASDPALRVLE